MADFDFDTVRQAVATKFLTVALIVTSTKDNLDNWAGEVEIKVGAAAYELNDQPNANVEMYGLTLPCSLLIPIPAEASAAQGTVNTITRGIQLAWRTATHLGLVATYDNSQIQFCRSRVMSMAPNPDGDWAGEKCLEWAVEVFVEVHEILNTARSTV